MTDEHAVGAVMGALVGDAAGAVLEFFGREITQADVEHAMTMPGGGTWNVAPGQVTDDGELTMSLLQALAEDPDHPTEAAALRYAAWASSDPFDIGATTAASLGCLRRHDRKAQAETHGAARVMAAVAQEKCMGSKANGSLMRATPLGVWGKARSREATIEATLGDARLSHPNPACVGAAVAYVLAIRHLLVTPGDDRGAIAEAARALETVAFDEPRAWLAEARAGGKVAYAPMDGFVRIAFTHAFRHLVAGTAWDDAIAETLLGGGDTDTNAAIVGGLLGARWGVSGIPGRMLEAVLGATPDAGAHPPPAALHPRLVPALVAKVG